MKRLLSLVLAAVAVGASALASAQTIEKISAAEVVEILGAMEIQATAADGSVTWMEDGREMAIRLFDEEENLADEGAIELMFQARAQVASTEEACNNWNMASRFGRVYPVDGETVFEMDYSLEGGVTRENLTKFVGRFLATALDVIESVTSGDMASPDGEGEMGSLMRVLTVEDLAEMIASVEMEPGEDPLGDVEARAFTKDGIQYRVVGFQDMDDPQEGQFTSVMFQAQLRTDAISMADANAWNTASRFGRMYVVEGDVFIEVDYSLEAGVPLETLVAWLGRFIETVEEANVTAPGMSAGGVRLAS